MRFSGCIYDLLRQRSLSDYFAGLTSKEIRRRLIARLRFDDLFSCDNPVDVAGACIVVSASDVIEGPLFVSMEAEDLTAVNLEICAPPSVVRAERPVAQLLRRWIQNDDGAGRPFILNILPSENDRLMVAEEVTKRRGLNIQTVDDAVAIIRATGLSADTVARVREHWWRWETLLCSTGGLVLAPYRQAASAVQMLKDFRAADGDDDIAGAHLSAEFGEPCFDEALALLAHAHGRRDVVVAYFDRIAKTTYSASDRAQLAFLRALFYHYMFRAIAQGNAAGAEFLAKVGDADASALSKEQFDTLPSVPSIRDTAYRLTLPPRIISALADLTAQDYQSIRHAHRVGIAIGIGEFLATTQTESLERAIEKLARDIVSRQSSTTRQEIARTIAFPAARLGLTMVGGATGYMLAETVAGAVVGASAADFAGVGETVLQRAATEGRSWLLERSFVARVQVEVAPGPVN